MLIVIFAKGLLTLVAQVLARTVKHFRLAHWITAYLWKRGQAVVGSVNATTALLRAAKRKFTGINRGDRPLMPSPYGTNNVRMMYETQYGR